MTPAEKQAFVARMAAARGKKPAPKPAQSASQQPIQSVAGNFGTCPNCSKNAGMVHSC